MEVLQFDKTMILPSSSQHHLLTADRELLGCWKSPNEIFVIEHSLRYETVSTISAMNRGEFEGGKERKYLPRVDIIYPVDTAIRTPWQRILPHQENPSFTYVKYERIRAEWRSWAIFDQCRARGTSPTRPSWTLLQLCDIYRWHDWGNCEATKHLNILGQTSRHILVICSTNDKWCRSCSVTYLDLLTVPRRRC